MRFTILLTANDGKVETVLSCDSWETEMALGPVLDELKIVIAEFIASKEVELAEQLA